MTIIDYLLIGGVAAADNPVHSSALPELASREREQSQKPDPGVHRPLGAQRSMRLRRDRQKRHGRAVASCARRSLHERAMCVE